MKILTISIILAVFISGCASGPQPAQISLDDNQNIKTIALLDIDELPEHLALSFSGAPAVFGIFGGLVSANNQQKATDKLTALMKGDGLAIGDLLTKEIEETLINKGYTVERLSNAREKPGYILTDFTNIETNADIVFDVIFTMAGYADRGIGKPYKPLVMVRAQAISMQTNELIYSDVLNYGYKLLDDKWVYIEPTEVIEFSDLESLLSDADLTKKGLTNSVRPIAQELTRDF